MTTSVESDRASDLIGNEAIRLLCQVQESWFGVNRDEITSAAYDALAQLVNIGWFECRIRATLRMDGQPEILQVQYRFTRRLARDPVLDVLHSAMLSHWLDADGVNKGRCRHVPSRHLQVRLTAAGVAAQQDIHDGRRELVLHSLRQDNPNNQLPGEFNIESWDVEVPTFDGAVPHGISVAQDGLKENIENPIQRGNQQQAVSMAHPAAAKPSIDKDPSVLSKPRKRGRKSDTEQWLSQYLDKHSQSYHAAVDAVLRSIPGALERFKVEFGPTAIATYLASETGGDEFEVERFKTAIQNTSLYRNHIKPVIGGRPPQGWSVGNNNVSNRLAQEVQRVRNQARGAR